MTANGLTGAMRGQARISTFGLSVSLLATVGFAFCVTLAVRGIMAVAAVGGSCSSGGPYVSAQPCPAGTGFIFVGIFGAILCGLVFVISLLVGRRPRPEPAPEIATAAWSSTAFVAAQLHVDDLRDAGDAPTVTVADRSGIVDQLERLAALHRSGALSDIQYEQAKSALLDHIGDERQQGAWG